MRGVWVPFWGAHPDTPGPKIRAHDLPPALTYPLTAVISDLHGNRPATEVCLADAEARGVERFVCLGDVVGYGAEPRACLDEVMVKIAGRDASENGPALHPGLCLRGNHEEALLFSADDFNPKAVSYTHLTLPTTPYV